MTTSLSSSEIMPEFSRELETPLTKDEKSYQKPDDKSYDKFEDEKPIHRKSLESDKFPIEDEKPYQKHDEKLEEKQLSQASLEADELLEALQGRKEKEAYEKAINWLKQNKYDSAHAATIGFLAASSVQSGYDQALKAFWEALLSAPIDVLGVGHLRLMLHALTKANFDSRIPRRAELFREIGQWWRGLLKAEFKTRLQSDRVERESHFIEIMQALVEQYPQAICHIPWSLPKSVLKSLQKKNSVEQKTALQIFQKIAKALRLQPEVLRLVAKGIKSEDDAIRCAAIQVLIHLESTVWADQPAILSKVIKALKDQDGEVRLAAVQALSQLEADFLKSHSEILLHLFVAASDKDASVKQAASAKLLTIKADALLTQPNILENIMKAVSSDDLVMVKTALGILGNLGDQCKIFPEALKTVIKATQHSDWIVRFYALKAMQKMGSTVIDRKKTFTMVLQLTEDLNEQVADAAKEILWAFGPCLKDAKDEILETIFSMADSKNKYHPRWKTRCVLIELLGDLGDSIQEKYPEVLKNLIRVAGDEDESNKIRQAAVKALIKLPNVWVKNPQAISAVVQMAEMKQDESSYLQNKIMVAIQKLDHELLEYPELFKLVLKSTYQHAMSNEARNILFRQSVISALLSKPEALDIVLETAQDKSWVVRQNVLNLIGHLQNKLLSQSKVLDAVIRASQDRIPHVRKVAFEILFKLKEKLAENPEILEIMANAVTHEDFPDAHRIVAKAFVQLGKSKLIELAESKSAKVRQAVIQIFSHPDLKMDPSEVRSRMIQAIHKDSDDAVCITAIQRLAQSGASLAENPEVLKVLLKTAQEHSSWQVRLAAIKALGKMESAMLVKQAQAVSVIVRTIANESEREEVRQAAREIQQAWEALASKISQKKPMSEEIKTVQPPKPLDHGSVTAPLSLEDKPISKESSSTGTMEVASLFISDIKLLKTVIEKTGHKDQKTRQEAKQQLSALHPVVLMQNPEILTVFLEAADHSNPYVRWATVEIIAKLGASLVLYPQALKRVIAAVGDPDRDVAKVGIEGLNQLDVTIFGSHPEIFEAIFHAMNSPLTHVRETAELIANKLTRLTSLSGTEALPILFEALGSQQKKINQMVMILLDKISSSDLTSSPKALEFILKTTNDYYQPVREAGIKMLGRLDMGILLSKPESLALILKMAKNEYVQSLLPLIDQSIDKLSADDFLSSPKAFNDIIQASMEKSTSNIVFKLFAKLNGANLAANVEILNQLLQWADHRDDSIQLLINQTFDKLKGPLLASYPDSLNLIVEATENKSLPVRQAAIRIMNSLDWSALLQNYLKAEEEIHLNPGKKQENIWLPFLLKRIKQTLPSIGLMGNTFWMVDGTHSEQIKLKSADLIFPLFKAVEKEWMKYRLPSTAFSEVMGQGSCERSKETTQKKPEFKFLKSLFFTSPSKSRGETSENLPKGCSVSH